MNLKEKCILFPVSVFRDLDENCMGLPPVNVPRQFTVLLVNVTVIKHLTWDVKKVEDKYI